MAMSSLDRQFVDDVVFRDSASSGTFGGSLASYTPRHYPHRHRFARELSANIHVLAASERGDLERVKQIVAQSPHLRGDAATSRDSGSQVFTPIAPIDDVTDARGANPLINAASSGNVQLVRYFVESMHADINRPISDGFTAATVAAYLGHLPIVEYVCGRPEYDWEMSLDYPPLIGAASGHLPIVKFFIEKAGVDVNSRGMGGFTALMTAARLGEVGIIEYLVANGADTSLTNASGEDAFDMIENAARKKQEPQEKHGGKRREKDERLLAERSVANDASLSAADAKAAESAKKKRAALFDAIERGKKRRRAKTFGTVGGGRMRACIQRLSVSQHTSVLQSGNQSVGSRHSSDNEHSNDHESDGTGDAFDSHECLQPDNRWGTRSRAEDATTTYQGSRSHRDAKPTPSSGSSGRDAPHSRFCTIQ